MPLNTYVTNVVEGKIYVVDGQQRLTTITLILIKLKHLAEASNSTLTDWIKNKITGHSGFKKEFWMNHEIHKTAMQALLDGASIDKIDVSSGITALNMVGNYQIISKWIDEEIASNKHKLESFIFLLFE